MLKYSEILPLMLGKGFSVVAETDKKLAVRSDALDQPIYLNKTAGDSASTIVIHPQLDSLRDNLLSIHGVKSNGDQWYHSSNMKLFPKRINKGKTPIAYGIPFGIESERVLNEFLWALQGNDLTDGNPFDDIAAAEQELSGCDETTRESLIEARIGQGQFRAKLIEYWGGCAVTGCDFIPVLIASHARPWRDSSNSDRLNPFNGLLLTPNLDKAFDQGFITFENNGRVLISPRLNESTRLALGITDQLKLRSIDAKHYPYFQWHRSHVFLK